MQLHKNQLSMNISTYFKYAFIMLSLSLSTFSHATPADTERAKKIAQATIRYISNTSLDNAVVLYALIQNISEQETRENYKEYLKNNPKAFEPPGPESLFIGHSDEKMPEEDLKIIQPAFAKKEKFVAEMYASCKLTGEITQISPTIYDVPILCRLPSSTIGAISLLKQSKNESDIAFAARNLNHMVDRMATAPKENFETSILIRVNPDNHHFEPALLEEPYFPMSLNRQLPEITGQ